VSWTAVGDVDVGAIVEALRRLVDRHAALRTALRATDGGVRQVVGAAGEPVVWRVDVSAGREPEIALFKIAVEAADQPFTLTEAPLWRVGIVRLDLRRYVVILVLHHAIADGWSTAVAVRDVWRLYEGIVRRRAVVLPRVELDFTDYAKWERAFSHSADEQFWYERVWPPASGLSLCSPWGEHDGGTFEMVERAFPALPPDAALSLAKLGRSAGATMASVVSAVVVAALARYADGEMSVGGIYANREQSELQPVIGPIIDYVPLRVATELEVSFVELLARVKEEQLRAKAHRIPFGLIERMIDTRYGRPRRRILDVAVNFLPSGPPRARSISNLTVGATEFALWPVPAVGLRPRGDRAFVATVPLCYTVRENVDGSLDGTILGNEKVLATEVIEALVREFAATVAQVIDNPMVRLRTLDGGPGPF
jgi:hypothetical protein